MICYMSFTLTVLDQTERCLYFSSSPLYCHLLFTEGRHRHTCTRRQMQRRKEKGSLKTSWYVLQNAYLKAIFLICFCSFIIRKPEGPLGDVCSVGLRGELCKCEVKARHRKSRSLSGGERHRRTPRKIVLWRKINLSSRRRLRSKKIRLTFPFSSTISLPLSPTFISFIWASQSLPLTLSVSVFKEKIKQLTMMIKVTGPIKLHMKWLSTLSQHLGQRNTHTHTHSVLPSHSHCQILMERLSFLVTWAYDIV